MRIRNPDSGPCDADAGTAWYAAVMAPWQHRAELPPCVAPDIDGLVNALQTLRTLPWLQRPVLVRGWVAAAVKNSRHGQLDPIASPVHITRIYGFQVYETLFAWDEKWQPQPLMRQPSPHRLSLSRPCRLRL